MKWYLDHLEVKEQDWSNVGISKNYLDIKVFTNVGHAYIYTHTL